MVAKDFGSVFGGDLYVSANTKFSNVWLQLYSNELFEENFGSVIYMDAQNVPVTIIEDSIFRNNFGDYGASISMKGGGGLYCKRCQFEMDHRYSKLKIEQLESLRLIKKEFGWKLPQYSSFDNEQE